MPAVQAPPPPNTHDRQTAKTPQPRGKRRQPWWQHVSIVVMLLPLLAILIYVVGFFLLLPGTGLKPDLLDTRIQTQTSSGILEPIDNGTYIQTRENTLYALYAYSQITPAAPPNLAIFSPQDIRFLVMRQNAFGSYSDYQLYTMDSQGLLHPVATDIEHIPVPMVASITISMPHGHAWAPGTYVLHIPGDGMDDEDFWYYFGIK